MSFSPIDGGGTSGAVASIIIQLIQAILRGSNISSAGGDSPKINRVLSTDVNAGDFGGIIDAAIQDLVNQTIQEQEEGRPGLAQLGEQGGDLTTGAGDEGGLTEAQGVGLGRQALATLRDPTSLVTEGLSKLPHAALIAFALALLPLIITELTKPGGPWDLRFKRIVENEFNALMDRQTAYDIRIGERSIIVQSRAGFINKNGAASNTNTLREIREGGINKDFFNEVGYIDHSRGLF